MLLLLLILAILAHLAFVLWQLKRLRSSNTLRDAVVGSMALSSLVPGATAVFMALLFLVVGASRTAQFNAGSGVLGSAWSLWVDLWILLLIANGVSAVANAIWFFVTIVLARWRPLALFGACGAALSALAFYTVFSFYPTA